MTRRATPWATWWGTARARSAGVALVAFLLGFVPTGVAVVASAADGEPGMGLWFLSDRAAGEGWEGVKERSEDPARDPDLKEWGVRAQGARHYSRKVATGVEVCSIEIWAFESEAAAQRAEQGLAYPGWRFDQQGHLLVMLRGLRWLSDGTSHTGLFPDCLTLGDRASARVAALLGR